MDLDVKKFLGVGLKTAVALTVFMWILTVIAKTVLIKHPVAGVSEFVNAV